LLDVTTLYSSIITSSKFYSIYSDWKSVDSFGTSTSNYPVSNLLKVGVGS